MNKLNLLFLSAVLVGLVLAGCKKGDDRKNYLQTQGSTYDLVLGDMENYGEVDGAYDIYLNLFTTGITVNSSGIQDGAGTIITVELLSDVNDGLSTGTYSFDSPTEAFTISNFGYCLDWTANSSSNTWSYLDKTKGGYLKIKRTGSNYEVDFKGVDDEGNSVKGNFSGTMTMYNFLSAK